MPRKPQFTVAQVETALRESGGLRSRAATLLDCSWTTVNNYCRQHAKLQEVIGEARESLADEAEQSLRDLIRERNVPATIFALKTLGKQRGYIERQWEVDVHPNVELRIKLPEDWPENDYDDPAINPNSPTKPPN